MIIDTLTVVWYYFCTMLFLFHCLFLRKLRRAKNAIKKCLKYSIVRLKNFVRDLTRAKDWWYTPFKIDWFQITKCVTRVLINLCVAHRSERISQVPNSTKLRRGKFTRRTNPIWIFMQIPECIIPYRWYIKQIFTHKTKIVNRWYMRM